MMGILSDMIIGVGVDIIEISRIQNACNKKSFLHKIYTQREIDVFDGRFKSLAGNFAVKEAVSKAFGTGIRGFDIKDIEVLRNDAGMPYVILYNNAKAIADKLGIKNIFVSISHNLDNAIGYAIVEG